MKELVHLASSIPRPNEACRAGKGEIASGCLRCLLFRRPNPTMTKRQQLMQPEHVVQVRGAYEERETQM